MRPDQDSIAEAGPPQSEAGPSDAGPSETGSASSASAASTSTSEPEREAVDDGPAEITGLRKAAIFILSLEESVASELLRSFSDKVLERLTGEIARLGVVEQGPLFAVLQEFHDLSQLQGVLKEGGLDNAIRLVERSFPPDRSRHLIQLLESNKPHLPLAFLARVETDRLLAFLENEHPQTVAVVLAHMTPSKAAELLDAMGDERRLDLVQRIASLRGTSEEVLEQLEKSLRKIVDEAELSSSTEYRGGVQAAADILKVSGRGGRDLLSGLRQARPDLVDDIYGRLFLFEDIVKLDDLSLKRLLQSVDHRRLAMALKTAPVSLEERVFAALSHDEGEFVHEETDRLGAVRVGDVEAARQKIVETLLDLEESGDVYIEGRGAREDRLVY